jgi:glyoxylase-like metal-dependent hydrolase (beta-lactamase superfamily II)
VVNPSWAGRNRWTAHFTPSAIRRATKRWYSSAFCGNTKREAIGVQLIASLKEAHDAGDQDLAKTLGHEIAVIQRTVAAPDRLAAGVDLFPLYGVTPGLTGLLLPTAGATTLVAGDAVPTIEHLAAGQVLSPCHDLEAARESFSEAVEIADWVVCGRDNIVPNQSRRF